jgi:hypothetical protein
MEKNFLLRIPLVPKVFPYSLLEFLYLVIMLNYVRRLLSWFTVFEEEKRHHSAFLLISFITLSFSYNETGYQQGPIPNLACHHIL